jgi:hypothetical protein
MVQINYNNKGHTEIKTCVFFHVVSMDFGGGSELYQIRAIVEHTTIILLAC